MSDLHTRFNKLMFWVMVSILMPGLYLAAPSIEAIFFPAVRIVDIQTQRITVDGKQFIEVRGTMNKLRSHCKIEDLYAMGGEPLRLLHLDRTEDSGKLINRPAGLQAFGPWIIDAPSLNPSPFAVHVQHSCGMPWRTLTILFYAERM